VRPRRSAAPVLTVLALVVALVLSACTGVRVGGGDSTGDPAGPAGGFPPGAASAGDPYLPTAGNGGYQVEHYHLAVTYDPASEELTGLATITAIATGDLSVFSLDLSDRLAVIGVRIDGEPAGADPGNGKLTVTPLAGIPRGREFTVTVDYHGRPEPVHHPQLGSNGFHHTDEGAFVVGQPRSAATWFPVNDHPRDKATYTIEVTVPAGLAAVSNGVLEERQDDGGWSTWRWAERTPMASYLTALAIGDYRVTTGEHHDGRPVVVAVHTDLPESVDEQLRRTPEIADVLAGWFGPYPVDAYGGIALADERVGFALETQSRPVYGPGFFRGARDATWVIVHELAHQWFGNSVSLHEWRHMWLNEGFATYAEWLWTEHSGGLTVQQSFDFFYDSADSDFWEVLPADPGPERLFHPAVYRRGAMAVHALRLEIGDEAFFELLPAWTQRHADGTVTTDDLLALAEEISGESLKPLFDEWLHTPGRPPHPTR
jgi:aminopeptidase N